MKIVGSLDKSCKNVKTETGWMPIKQYKALHPDFNLETDIKIKRSSKQYVYKFATIAEAQEAYWHRKVITLREYHLEQDAILKIKRNVTQ